MWEWRTSMSPRLNEITTFFEKRSMYHAFRKVFGRVPKLGSAVFQSFLAKKRVPKTLYIRKSEKKWWFRVRGAHIDVTTLERNCYFFWKVTDVLTVLHGFATPKIIKKSVQNAKYIRTSVKKVPILHGRCEHRCHHAAARDLLFEIIFRCMERFAKFFWPVRVWALFGCGAVYILIWCSVCGVVWCGVVKSPDRTH